MGVFGGVRRCVATVAALTGISSFGCPIPTVTDDPLDIHALDSIHLGNTPSYQEGFTGSGVRYKIVRNEGQPFYSNSYSIGRPGYDRIRIEFDPPVAAVGAECLTSGFHPFVRPPEQFLTRTPLLYFSQTGYLGLLGDGQAISEVTLVTDGGPLVVSRIDLRPFPVAHSETFTTKERTVPPEEAYLLGNDPFSEGAELVSAPMHAEKFELRDDGTFVYVARPGYSGLDSFEYRTHNGHRSAYSQRATATIEVPAQSSPPTFRHSGDVACQSRGGPQRVAGWAYDVDPGSPDEWERALSWRLEIDRPDLFLTPPSINSAGDLLFEPCPGQSGIANIAIWLVSEVEFDRAPARHSLPQVVLIRVEDSEVAPVLPAIPDLLVDPVEGLRVCAASKSSFPAFPVLYRLESGPPGATVDAESGWIRWAGTTHPGLYEFRVSATEQGPLALSSSIAFRAEIVEPQSPLARLLFRGRHAADFALRSASHGSKGTTGAAAMTLTKAAGSPAK